MGKIWQLFVPTSGHTGSSKRAKDQIALTQISKMSITVAAIAQWNHQRLPSCGPGFKSQAHQLRFLIYIVQIIYLSLEWDCEKNKNKEKVAGIGQFFSEKLSIWHLAQGCFNLGQLR